MSQEKLWFPIHHFENYQVTQDGDVRAVSNHYPASTMTDENGETIVILRDRLLVRHERPLKQLMHDTFLDIFPKED